MLFYFFFFFFSSRRWHTRFDCDWSSDVCSSDLLLERRDARVEHLAFARVLDATVQIAKRQAAGVHVERLVSDERLRELFVVRDRDATERSEERRVGKECRSRWELGHIKKKR